MREVGTPGSCTGTRAGCLSLSFLLYLSTTAVAICSSSDRHDDCKRAIAYPEDTALNTRGHGVYHDRNFLSNKFEPVLSLCCACFLLTWSLHCAAARSNHTPCEPSSILILPPKPSSVRDDFMSLNEELDLANRRKQQNSSYRTKLFYKPLLCDG